MTPAKAKAFAEEYMRTTYGALFGHDGWQAPPGYPNDAIGWFYHTRREEPNMWFLALNCSTGEFRVYEGRETIAPKQGERKEIDQ